MVSIITSITDGYDTLKKIKPQVGMNVEWIAVTDGTETAEPGHGWEVLNIHNYPGWSTEHDRRHPNRLAKVVKYLPWLVSEAPYSIWIDGSYRVTSPVFAVEALKCARPIAQFIHPWRDCVYDEARASLALHKYRDETATITRQIEEYSDIGHPVHWGLWATGVIARKHTNDVKVMGAQWLAETRRHSYQDQISQPVVLRFSDLRPSPLPGNHITNPWLTYEGSARH